MYFKPIIHGLPNRWIKDYHTLLWSKKFTTGLNDEDRKDKPIKGHFLTFSAVLQLLVQCKPPQSS